MLKRSLDIIVSFLLATIFALPAIIIWVTLKIIYGKAIFSQARTGLHGKNFTIFKFMTLREDDALLEPERITKVGRFLRKTSLDEIPQIVNILKGDMSLIGPRPLLPEYLPLYTEKIAARHTIKPGLTGLAQVSGGNALSWERKFELDIYYVNNRSLMLDLKILWLTFLKIFNRKDVEARVMEKYTGGGSHE